MAVVTLRSPLRQLADDRGEVEVQGSTLGDVLAGLERLHPRLTGWVLDERGEIREHVNVFVNGERSPITTQVADRDRVQIIQNISGGSGDSSLCRRSGSARSDERTPAQDGGA